jgi:hypothetical protein
MQGQKIWSGDESFNFPKLTFCSASSLNPHAHNSLNWDLGRRRNSIRQAPESQREIQLFTMSLFVLAETPAGSVFEAFSYLFLAMIDDRVYLDLD